MRTSNIITPMLGHSHSFHYNIRENCNPSSFVRLNQGTVDDIYPWRCLLTLSFSDARVLCTPTYAPLLRMKVHADEPFSARDIRSAQRADIIGYLMRVLVISLLRLFLLMPLLVLVDIFPD
jgi:hypothetical protein